MYDRKPIPGYEGYYEIDTDGVVYSLPREVMRGHPTRKTHIYRVPGCILQPILNVDGYYIVILYKDEERWVIGIHHLLLMTFGSLPKPGELCRHLNDNRTDNRLENLAWGTHQDNADDARRNGRHKRGESHKNSKLTDEAVKEIIRRCRTGEVEGVVGKDYGVKANTVNDIMNNRTWTHIDRDSL